MRKKKSPDQPTEWAIWSQRVARARQIREDWTRTYQVEQCEQFILGQQREKGDRGIVLNHLLASLKTIRPTLFYQHPKFLVRAKPGQAPPAQERQAAIGEAVLEAIAAQQQNLKQAGDLSVWQAFTRIGVLKVIYDPALVPNPKAGETIVVTDADGQPVLDPETQAPMQLRDPATGGLILEPEDVLSDEVYRWAWVDAANMLLPDDGCDPSQWGWVGEEIVVPLAEAQRDARFPKALRSRLVANVAAPSARGRSGRPKSDSQELEPQLRYLEVYDYETRRQKIWAEGQADEEFLVDRPVPAGVEKDPYALLLGYTKIMGPEPSPWPLPYVYPWLDAQREYNLRRQQIIEGAKRSARKGWYTEGAFTDEDEAVKALQSGEDMIFAKVTDKNAIGMLEAPNLNPAIYNDVSLLIQDWYRLTGLPASRLGASGGDTATENIILDRNSSLRDSEMQSAVNLWLAVAGKKMLQLVTATLTLKLWVKLRGFNDKEFQSYAQQVYGLPPEALHFLPGLKESFMAQFGEQEWRPITREALAFESEVEVVPGSAKPRNLEVEREQWMKFLQMIGQYPQLALSRELLRETAAKFEHIPERMLDELTALAQQMVQINANQAGRTQGGQSPGAGQPMQQQMAGRMGGLAGLMNGGMR